MSRKALGRGLSALLGDEAKVETASGQKDFLELDLDLIQPNSDQPRKNFPEKELKELAQSIRANGVVQPIIVRRKGKQYQIVAGERRWRAAQLAELTKIPAVIKEVSDDKLLELALIENIQRQELNAIEEARAYKNLIEKLGLTHDKIAKQVGKTRTFITNYLRLLNLPDNILELVENEKLSVGHARALLVLEDKASQNEFAKNIIASALSVRDTEKAVKRFVEGGVKEEKEKKTPKEKDPNVKNAENKLRRYYGTQIRIIPAKKGGSGKIELEYYNEADLDRIYKLLMTKQLEFFKEKLESK